MARITKGIPGGFLGKAGMVVGPIGEVEVRHRFSPALKTFKKTFRFKNQMFYMDYIFSWENVVFRKSIKHDTFCRIAGIPLPQKVYRKIKQNNINS